MELLNGGTLYEYREKCDLFQINEETTKMFASQIICGLQFLHSNKIIHR